MEKSNIELLLILLSTLIAPLLFSQENPELSIQVSNIQEVKGNIMIAVYDSPGTFLGEKVKTGWVVPVTQKGNMEFLVNNLPTGSYAISIYHDENENETLDSNMLRIPKEPYGFSNNTKTIFGPPSFEESKFEIGKSKQVVKIALN